MRFQYKQFVIDASPDLSDGRFIARARIAPGALTGEEFPGIISQGNLATFSCEAFAVEYAVEWATKWIDAQAENLG